MQSCGKGISSKIFDMKLISLTSSKQISPQQGDCYGILLKRNLDIINLSGWQKKVTFSSGKTPGPKLLKSSVTEILKNLKKKRSNRCFPTFLEKMRNHLYLPHQLQRRCLQDTLRTKDYTRMHTILAGLLWEITILTLPVLTTFHLTWALVWTLPQIFLNSHHLLQIIQSLIPLSKVNRFLITEVLLFSLLLLVRNFNFLILR